jgi:chloramphenicol 3-O-phosphotransferase
MGLLLLSSSASDERRFRSNGSGPREELPAESPSRDRERATAGDRSILRQAVGGEDDDVCASPRPGQKVAGVTILSGPIGAGKTAVSKELIALWSAPLATIGGDQFWPFLVKRAKGDRREDFRVIKRAMTSAAGSLARTGYDVLLDFSIPPAFLPTAQKILSDAPLDYIVLRPPLEVCAARARDRAEGKIAKYDRGFYALFAAEERHVVAPDDGKSPKAIAEILHTGLKEGSFRVEPSGAPSP